jgi:serine/threonine protein kinase
MITDQGFVKVMDFGIARRIDEMIDPAQVRDVASDVPQGILMAKTRTIVGTPQYMPPEAGLGVVSPLTDVYTLGVCMYEMCTGRMPYGANSDQAKLQRSYARVRDLMPGTEEEVERLIYDAVDPDPKTRIQSARVFADRLDKLAALKEE